VSNAVLMMFESISDTSTSERKTRGGGISTLLQKKPEQHQYSQHDDHQYQRKNRSRNEGQQHQEHKKQKKNYLSLKFKFSYLGWKKRAIKMKENLAATMHKQNRYNAELHRKKEVRHHMPMKERIWLLFNQGQTEPIQEDGDSSSNSMISTTSSSSGNSSSCEMNHIIESITTPRISNEKIRFTYPLSKKHFQMVQDMKANTHNTVQLSFGPTHHDMAQILWKGMKRFQNVYDEKEQHDEIMRLFQSMVVGADEAAGSFSSADDPPKFTYPNWEQDIEETMIFYLKFNDGEGDEFWDAMILKQHMYQSDRSHNAVLVELDSLLSSCPTSLYRNCMDHAKTVEMALTTSFSENREISARKLLKGMQRLNSVLNPDVASIDIGLFAQPSSELVINSTYNDSQYDQHNAIIALYQDKYSYPRWERDFTEASNHFLRFQDTYAKDVIQVMKMKQKQKKHEDKSDYKRLKNDSGVFGDTPLLTPVEGKNDLFESEDLPHLHRGLEPQGVVERDQYSTIGASARAKKEWVEIELSARKYLHQGFRGNDNGFNLPTEHGIDCLPNDTMREF
jgi:hypothetical protein